MHSPLGGMTSAHFAPLIRRGQPSAVEHRRGLEQIVGRIDVEQLVGIVDLEQDRLDPLDAVAQRATYPLPRVSATASARRW